MTDDAGEANFERLETGSHLSGAEWSVRLGLVALAEPRYPIESEPHPGDVIDVLLTDTRDLAVELRREDGGAVDFPVQVAIQLPDKSDGHPHACAFIMRGGGGTIPWSGSTIEARLRAASIDGGWQTAADTSLQLSANVGSAEAVRLVLRQQPAIRLHLPDRAGRKLRLLYSRGISEPPLVTVTETTVRPDGEATARFAGLDQAMPRRRLDVEVLGAADHAEETAQIDLSNRFPTNGVLDVGVVELRVIATIATVAIEFDGGSAPSLEPRFFVVPAEQKDPIEVAVRYDPARSEYALSGIVHGAFSLTVTHPEYLNRRIDGLSPGARVRIRLARGGVLEGSVIVDAATASAELHLRVEADGLVVRDVEVSPGYFRLDGLPPGGLVRLTLLTRRMEFDIAQARDVRISHSGIVLDARGKLRHVRAHLVTSDATSTPSSIRATAPRAAALPVRNGFVEMYVPVDCSTVTLTAEGYAPTDVRLDADVVEVLLVRN